MTHDLPTHIHTIKAAAAHRLKLLEHLRVVRAQGNGTGPSAAAYAICSLISS
jgi:hypothetical protein